MQSQLALLDRICDHQYYQKKVSAYHLARVLQIYLNQKPNLEILILFQYSDLFTLGWSLLHVGLLKPNECSINFKLKSLFYKQDEFSNVLWYFGVIFQLNLRKELLYLKILHFKHSLPLSLHSLDRIQGFPKLSVHSLHCFHCQSSVLFAILSLSADPSVCQRIPSKLACMSFRNNTWIGTPHSSDTSVPLASDPTPKCFAEAGDRK